MSENTVPRIDPRFDPRFQRGYDPDVAATAPNDAAVSAPRDAPLPPVLSPAPDPHRPPREPHSGTPSQSACDSAHDVDSRAIHDAELAWLEEEDSGPSAPDPWFLGAWTVAVVAFALGATLALAGIMGEDYMGGPLDEGQRWLQLLGWTVAPAIAQGGLVGIVVMLVWTGVRYARRSVAHTAEPS